MNGLHRTPDQITQRSDLAESLYSVILEDLNYGILETILDDYCYRLKEHEVEEWEEILHEEDEYEEETRYEVK